MSDKEFWESTPAKIFALLDYHSKVENPQNLDKKKKLDNETNWMYPYKKICYGY